MPQQQYPRPHYPTHATVPQDGSAQSGQAPIVHSMTQQMPLRPYPVLHRPIHHPNEPFISPRTLSFSGVPPTIFDSDLSSDEEDSYLYPQSRVRYCTAYELYSTL